ncbi:MAG: helix-turn-helix transcriptional regulator [Clostridia bacterium]|nr:helix-turn-helix transcriptional regulator [Clostridia bacterium]MBQ9401523.1 helix-turn-helix transcriptional regulator [Clostridia bacterium]
MNSIELKVAMKRNKDTLEKLAEALGLQVSGVWARVNGQTEFRAKEISKIRQRYNLSAEDIVKIFL